MMTANAIPKSSAATIIEPRIIRVVVLSRSLSRSNAIRRCPGDQFNQDSERRRSCCRSSSGGNRGDGDVISGYRPGCGNQLTRLEWVTILALEPIRLCSGLQCGHIEVAMCTISMQDHVLAADLLAACCLSTASYGQRRSDQQRASACSGQHPMDRSHDSPLKGPSPVVIWHTTMRTPKQPKQKLSRNRDIRSRLRWCLREGSPGINPCPAGFRLCPSGVPAVGTLLDRLHHTGPLVVAQQLAPRGSRRPPRPR